MKKETKIQKKGYVGIDISKRSLQVIRISGESKKDWLQVKTDEAGIKKLFSWLCEDDMVGLEAGNQSFWLAKKIQREVACEVIVLNPSDLAMIYQSFKKTDKEDALKIARLIQRIPREELPKVSLPTEEEEEARKLVSEQAYWSKQKVMNKNRLHSIFSREGHTQITKTHLQSHKNRLKYIAHLTGESNCLEAERLVGLLTYIDETLKGIEKQMKEMLKKNSSYVQLAFSMPGIGPITALTLFAWLGDFSRFLAAKQVSHYAGLVPRVKQSGDRSHYGHITKRGCRPIKRVMIQSAWALLRSQQGGDLVIFYQKLMQRAGKKRAAVAVARKMLEILHNMFQKGEMYRFMPQGKLEQKLAYYGLT